MRGVARENDVPMPERIHAFASKSVNADPFQFEAGFMPEKCLYAGHHLFWLYLFNGIRIPAQLEVDPPDIVRLTVQQHRLIRVEGRIEPEPALGGKVSLHLDVGDKESIVKDAAMAFLPQHLAYG